MKVTLTLKRGSFYFLKNVQLFRNVPKEIDLSKVTNVELKGLKLNVRGGTIIASQDFSKYTLPTEDKKTDPAPIVHEIPYEDEATAALNRANGGEAVVVGAPTHVEGGPVKEYAEHEFRDYTNRQLKDKLAELGVETTSTRKEDLIAEVVRALNTPKLPTLE